MINILILCYEEFGVVMIEFIYGRVFYVWINKMYMVLLYIIMIFIIGIEKNFIDYEWDVEMKFL